MPKVTIYTQAYNPGGYLKQCIESVLGQTYRDFEWILIDNASTDGTPALIDAYAEEDSRIIPIHMERNTHTSHMFYRFLREKGSGRYVTYLDSDDWWDPDYLEHLVPFAEENDLDFALTGAVQYLQREGTSSVLRQWDEPLLLTGDGFARNFPVIGPFAGALWASLRPMEKVLAMEGAPEDAEIWRQGMVWRSDTLMMLNYLDRCQRIGIDQYAPYHYRRYSGSLSRRYTDSYFKSNVYFCQKLEEYFRRHGVLDGTMEEYVKERYFFEMDWSLEVLRGTRMAADEKLRICAGMTSHPRTLAALSCRCREQETWRAKLQDIVDDALCSGEFSDTDALGALLRPLAPDCCEVLTVKGAALFARERDLLPLLFEDNRQALAKRFLELIEKEVEPERYDLGVMLRSVLAEESPLRVVEDVRFFKDHPALTRLVLGSGYLAALDRMTASLLEGGPLKSEEAFLQLYLTLAALEDQASAFLFGKVRLAELYQAQHRREECRTALRDLEEMGAGDLPEAAALRESCEREGLL